MLLNEKSKVLLFLVLFGVFSLVAQRPQKPAPSGENWKEYTFPNDGFAITFPEPPNPHPDANLPELTVYTVSVYPTAKLSMRVSHRNMDCAANLAQVKDRVSKNEVNAIPGSMKDIAIDGFPGVEYQYRPQNGNTMYDRFYCVNGKFYTFSSIWIGAQNMPSGIARIMSSFRLLKK